MVLRCSGLRHQQWQLFLSAILDQSECFFDCIDDERMFVHAHAARDFGYLLMSVLIEFYRNLDVIHKVKGGRWQNGKWELLSFFWYRFGRSLFEQLAPECQTRISGKHAMAP